MPAARDPLAPEADSPSPGPIEDVATAATNEANRPAPDSGRRCRGCRPPRCCGSSSCSRGMTAPFFVPRMRLTSVTQKSYDHSIFNDSILYPIPSPHPCQKPETLSRPHHRIALRIDWPLLALGTEIAYDHPHTNV